jgi:hypothetical protein
MPSQPVDDLAAWGEPKGSQRCGGCLFLVARGDLPGYGFCTNTPDIPPRGCEYPTRAFNQIACEAFVPRTTDTQLGRMKP